MIRTCEHKAPPGTGHRAQPCVPEGYRLLVLKRLSAYIRGCQDLHGRPGVGPTHNLPAGAKLTSDRCQSLQNQQPNLFHLFRMRTQREN